MKKKILLTLTTVFLCLFAFGLTASAETYGDLTYEVTNGEVTIIECDRSVTSVTVPATINGYPVTSIGEDAFYHCSSLTSIDLPDSVMSIGDSAFAYCSSLVSVEIPYDVTIIGDSVFYYCSSLESIELPDNVTSIGDYAFAYCSSLVSVEIPHGVTNIGDYAFSDCINLVNIEMSDSLTDIGRYVFYRCISLTNIKLSANVMNIDDGVFFWCDSLTSIEVDENNRNYSSENGVLFDKDKKTIITYPCGKSDTSYTIPDSVMSVGSGAFLNCYNLTHIEIPYGIANIGRSAFYYCKSLKSIELPNSITNIDNFAFSDCNNLNLVYFNGTEEDWNKLSIGDRNESLTENVIFVKHTKTTTSPDGKTFVVTPINVKNGETIILALFNGDSFLEMQSAVYEGEEITFATDKEYTMAKVMVWDSLENLSPSGKAEIIE